jgi:hypothetical protein
VQVVLHQRIFKKLGRLQNGTGRLSLATDAKPQRQNARIIGHASSAVCPTLLIPASKAQ